MVNINKEEVLSLTRGKRKFGNKITIPTSTKLEGELQQVSSNGEIFYSKVSGNSEMLEINIEKILRNSAERLKKIGIQGIDPSISSQAGSQGKVDGGIVDLELILLIITYEEKLGGRPHRIEESLDFIQYLNDCGLQDTGFSGSKYTWCDNRDPPATIWKKLDRLVHNSQWFGVFNATSVTHLSRTCSDHSPLLVKMNFDNTHIIKYFKFLNIWTEHTEFLETVKHSWNKEVFGNPLFVLHQNIKRTCKTLSSWSRQTFGDISEEPRKLKAQMRILEENSVTNNSEENREELSRLRAIFTKFLRLQNSILRQKARIKWLEEGDSNTAYFHNIIKDRRKKLTSRKIMDDHDNLLEGNDNIAEGDVRLPKSFHTRFN
ncbi:uncharacterized protein [Solanum tuberosum]|uniref:uncharacterized protein n=1 Tax=Solanum tuberosum TaxID=4113 RepID=UPI00073A2499|nr:PREDICTED: uncharacterized protein LOC107062725 [Solanum tuberosum]